ncbi:tetratricopeptide repeat protein [Robertkochia flava]|uniref:tetratricopeptide repeat protein n=1 Tax=Robertkochia flava TaxID=3447986 RepID=UPI001CC9746D|nr:tetratricopeptide repeat protein [Robertkochia marina]
MPFSAHDDRNLPLEKFESMLKTNDVYFFDSEDFQEIIHHYLDSGKIALAKKAIKIGLGQHPASTELKLLNVEVLVFENRFDAAETLLNEVEMIEVSNEEIFIQKANIYSKKDNHEKAIECLQIALSMSEEKADINSLLGMEFLFMDDYESARDAFLRCLEEDMEDYAALYNVIYCYEFLEDFDGAISFLNDYLNSNPYCEVAWHQLGKQFLSKKMLKEALTSFDFAIYSDDTFIGAYLEKGKVLEKMKRYNEAIENYEITLKLDDPTSYAFLRLGKCHDKLGNDDLAKKYFYKTVHEDPLLDKGWIAITDFYFKHQNYQKALYYINKAINIDSENVHYWKRCAKINELLNFYEEADLAYQKTIELGNYELRTWLSWADVLLQLGEYESAIHSLHQAMQFYPEHSDLEYRLAGMYYMISDNLKGDYHLRNALSHNYEDHETIEVLFPTVYKRATVKKLISSFREV